MDKILTLELTEETAAEMEEFIIECIAEMERARKQMLSDKTEIDRLKMETRMILAQLQVA